MIKKTFVLLGIFLLSAAAPMLVSAQQVSSVTEYHFVVWLHDGGKVSFPLEEHPMVTHSDGTLVVSSAESRVEYAHASVRKFTLSAADISQGETTAMSSAERTARWQCQGDAMVFCDCAPGECVSIYDAKGRLLQQCVIASDGTLEIPLHPFSAGVYIVKTERITYQFMKK